MLSKKWLLLACTTLHDGILYAELRCTDKRRGSMEVVLDETMLAKLQAAQVDINIHV